MAKGTQRRMRQSVLDELEDVDPAWHSQLVELRTTNPQAYRRQMIKVDVALAAKLDRPTTLSLRPKRFGGDEDPVLVRRVMELRKEQREVKRQVHVPSPAVERDEDEDGATWKQGRTPESEDKDIVPEGNRIRGRAPESEGKDIVPEGNRIRGRAPEDRPERPVPARGPEPDLSILDGTVGDARDALETGDHDATLDALEAAERAGKARKGVLKAIEGRR